VKTGTGFYSYTAGNKDLVVATRFQRQVKEWSTSPA
jgi:hypothetical protein